MFRKLQISRALLSFLVACTWGQEAVAQNQYKYRYFLNEDFASVDSVRAVMLGKGLFEDTLFRLDCFHPKTGKMLVRAHFSNSMLSELKGPFISWYPNGKKEQEGSFRESYHDGEWNMYNDEGQKTDSVFYDMETKLMTASYHYFPNGQLSFYEMTDSLHDKYIYKSFLKNGHKSVEAIFSGNTGSLKRYDSTGKDSYLSLVGSREKKEASFPGGDTAWYAYMYRNLDHSVGVKHKITPGRYFVPVLFMVEEDGTISAVKALSKFGYGLEKEAERYISSYPKWIPASIFGIPVPSVLIQAVRFEYAADRSH